MSQIASSSKVHDVIVVGAGAAGIGVGVTLRHADIEEFVILDRGQVADSFASWPEETRFITPSFATNSIGMLDINSIAIGTSPANLLRQEHPTGFHYSMYLRRVAEYFELPIREQAEVSSVAPAGDEFHVTLSDGEVVRSRHVIWAAGEFQYPSVKGVLGGEFCRHTATVDRYADLDGGTSDADRIVIIGGYESGIDAAYHLSRRGKKVTVIDAGCPWEERSSDPSIALATFTHERMHDPRFVQNVELHSNTPVLAVRHDRSTYTVAASGGKTFATSTPPLFAGGFEGSHTLVAHLFDQRQDGFPHLSDDDESTLVPGLFLCGPAVRHGNQSFCFIYKYRQRFAVVAKAIANSLGRPAEQLEMYRMWGMYLDDLSCCGQECVC